MRRQLHIAQVSCVLLALSMTAASCKGPRANVSLKKTNAMLSEMRDLNGQEHAPDRITEIERMVSQASQQLSAGESGQAFDIAKNARATAEQVLTEVKGAEARRIWNQAEEEIRVADRNGANRIDPDRYARITQLRDAASTARDENKHEEIIKNCRLLIQEAQTLLTSVRSDAERERISAENKLTELKSIGGPDYTPETVITVQDMISRAERVFNEERDYILAASQFRGAITEAENGIEAVLRAQSKEGIDEIETLLADSLAENAREFVPDEYNAVVRLHESLIADFANGQFGKVKLGVNELKPRAQLLKLSTKRAASDSRLRTMRREIDDLAEAGAREYLPNRLEVLEALFARAREVRQENTEAAFDRVKELSQESADEADKINRAFEDLATEAIRIAANRLDTTDQVFTQVGRIFAPANGDVPDDMRTFEERKEARRVQLGQEIQKAREALVVADNRMKEQKYRGAILLSQEQATVADNILGEVYRLVATNATIELSTLISRYERDGARLYAAEELQRSVADLARVKDAINSNNFLFATELAAAARANIELMAQRISGRAVEEIRTARETLRTSSSERTMRYSAESLANVSRLIEEAEVALRDDALKLAVEKATEATKMAQEASVAASKAAAEDAVDSAVAQIEKSQQAGAELYAGRDMESAKKLIDSAESLLDGEDYEKAEELAISSRERAEQAFLRKVVDAEAAIAEAKAVGGWEYDNRSLSRASADVRIARRNLEEGAYTQSQTLADGARERAADVARRAKENNYHEAVKRIKDNLETGRQQGINYFQVGDSIAVRQRLAEIQNEWSVERYDYIQAELMKLEGDLRQTLENTGAVVTLVADQQSARLDRLVEEGAIDYAGELTGDARQNLRLARLDYSKGLYKSAHSLLERAIRDIDEIELRYKREAYADQVRDLFKGYRAAQMRFANLLDLGPTQVKALATGPDARGNMVSISSQYTPAEFRAAVERLYSEIILVQPPKGMERVHESVVDAFNDGRVASIMFEKFVIMDEASTAEAGRLIDMAYATINRSNANISTLQRDFFMDEIRFRLVAADPAKLATAK